jgi:hypothetical protein
VLVAFGLAVADGEGLGDAFSFFGEAEALGDADGLGDAAAKALVVLTQAMTAAQAPVRRYRFIFISNLLGAEESFRWRCLTGARQSCSAGANIG